MHVRETYQCLWRGLGYSILCCLSLAARSAAAEWSAVVLLEESPIHAEIAAAAEQRLQERGVAVPLVRRHLDSATHNEDGSSPPSLIVTIGSRAAQQAVQQHAGIPTVHAALPESVYRKLLSTAPGDGGHQGRTALFLDQPAERQVRVIRTALPHFTRIGVLTADPNASYVKELRVAATNQGAALVVVHVDEPRLLITRLEDLLQRADTLLVTPDATLYNRFSLQKVLLAAYRQRKPVIGLSGSYVRAGALLAVHSEAATLGADLGDLIADLAASPTFPERLPPPRYPSRFSVSINRHVAGSLGLGTLLPEADVIEQALHQAEQAR